MVPRSAVGRRTAGVRARVRWGGAVGGRAATVRSRVRWGERSVPVAVAGRRRMSVRVGRGMAVRGRLRMPVRIPRPGMPRRQPVRMPAKLFWATSALCRGRAAAAAAATTPRRCGRGLPLGPLLAAGGAVVGAVVGAAVGVGAVAALFGACAPPGTDVASGAVDSLLAAACLPEVLARVSAGIWMTDGSSRGRLSGLRLRGRLLRSCLRLCRHDHVLAARHSASRLLRPRQRCLPQHAMGLQRTAS